VWCYGNTFAESAGLLDYVTIGYTFRDPEILTSAGIL